MGASIFGLVVASKIHEINVVFVGVSINTCNAYMEARVTVMTYLEPSTTSLVVAYQKSTLKPVMTAPQLAELVKGSGRTADG